MKLKIILLLGILIAILSLFLLSKYDIMNNVNNDNFNKLEKLNYSKEVINLIIDNNIDDYLIKDNIYSKTLEEALIQDKYYDSNLEIYCVIKYVDKDDFIDNLNKLIELGYSKDEIDKLFNYLDDTDITVISNSNEKYNEIINYCKNDKFILNYYNRYIDYKSKNQQYDYDTIIKYVNIGIDYPFFENIKESANKYTELVLINKYYKVDENYIPKNLETLDISCASNSNIYMENVAKEAFENMCMDARSIGFTIKGISGYRSYISQENIYNGYLKNDPQSVVDTYSARPGHSEHQSGYVIDVYNVALPYTSFGDTNEYVWVKNNARKYGFIVRYEKNKEFITGYKSEPWHLRYVGIDAADYISKNNITLEEYLYEKGKI